MHSLTQFAATSNQNVFVSLGIDWQMLILQIIAFLILVFLLGKYVYPWLMKSVDARKEEMDAAARLATETKADALKTEERMAALLEDARQEAAEIVNTARLESATALSDNEAKIKKQADRIIADAHDQIDKDVIAAKKELYNETIDLVASATEKVVGKVTTAKQNESIIAAAIKESK